MFCLKNNLSLISINARGLRDITKRKSFFLFCKGKNANIILLQETHSKPEDCNFWCKQWGDEMYLCHGTSRSAGVAVLFKNFKGKVVSQHKDEHGHWLILILDIDNFKLILINIYGYNITNQNKLLLEEIALRLDSLKLKYSTNNVIIGGDINLVQDEFLDKWPSKYSSNHPNTVFNNFCNEQNLVDVWRHLNPETIQFTWFSSNYKSRIDHWLVANDLLTYDISSDISVAPLTDHSLILLQLKPLNQKQGASKYWKFNSNLLNNDTYCENIRAILSEVINLVELDTPVRKWEFFKYKVRLFSISFSKKSLKELQEKERDLVQQLNFYCNKPNPTDEDKQKILSLQAKLDEMYVQKAKGAFVRSRAKWIEEGEKNSAYFCNLEKRRQQRNAIQSLLINNIETTDEKSISTEIFQFYSNLYSSNFSEKHCRVFLNSIKTHIPKIDDTFKKTCEDNITRAELDKAVKCLSLNKAPGPDGLTVNFYRHFWDEIKELLHNVFLDIFESYSLPPTMRQGVIISIPKANKDHRIIENRRPISLRNTDYKLLAYIFKTRLQSGISNIVAESQSGFLKGRSIHNNIRLVMDIVEYRDLIRDDGFIFF